MKILLSLFAIVSFAFAKEGYYRIPLPDLLSEEDKEAASAVLISQHGYTGWERHIGSISKLPKLRFAIEVFPSRDPGDQGAGRDVPLPRDLIAVFHLKELNAQDGFLDLWDHETQKWRSFPCHLDPAKLKPCEEADRQKMQEWYYRHLFESNVIGDLWFRSHFSMGQTDRRRRNASLDDTFSVMTGGRAIAENLALDRELILGRGKSEKMIPISEIKGVTVEPIPWKERMPKGEVTIDPLAMMVPEDQHLMVVPSLKQLFLLMERLEDEGTPIIQSFSVRNSFRDLPTRYRKQMGLDLPDAIAKLLPVKSVAVTGGDPFFPTGSDVAVLFETDNPELVFESIRTVLAGKASSMSVKEQTSENYVSYQSDDRSFSSHLARVGGAVVVANSKAQILRLREVKGNKVPALGASDEYRFFRHRYPIAQSESAYVFISDATLRRWSGPRMRIGASRRTRAMAALGGLQSQQIRQEKLSTAFVDLVGDVESREGVIASETFGSLSFVTPIGELKIDQVSKKEQEGYERWRRGYEGGWAQFFDPIAIRFALNEKTEELDLTVLPLRVDSDYEEFLSLVGNARLSAKAKQVAPETVFQFSMAIDRESRLFKEGDQQLVSLIPGLKVNPLAWVGNSLTVMGEESLVWTALYSGNRFFDLYASLPVLLRVESNSALKLALFLSGVKATVETAAPGLVKWENRKHGEQPYVVLRGNRDLMGQDLSIYYAAMPGAFLISVREDTLKRAIDREVIKNEEKPGREQLFAHADLDVLRGMSEGFGGESWVGRRQGESWRALPILNEWRRRFAQKDPMAFHRKCFASAIVCPGGKGFRWNEKALTMESVAYGYPAAPRRDGDRLDLLDRFKTARMSADFEEGGLRLKARLSDEGKKATTTGTPRPEKGCVQICEYLDVVHPGVRVFSVEREMGREKDQYQLEGEVKILKDAKGGVTYRLEQRELKDGKVENSFSRTMHYDNGLSVLEWSGANFAVKYPDGAGAIPSEIWLGQETPFEVQAQMMLDGRELIYRERGVHRIVGWEEVEILDGEKVNCLRSETKKEVLTEGRYHTEVSTDWSCEKYGTVKWDYTRPGMKMTGVLAELK